MTSNRKAELEVAIKCGVCDDMQAHRELYELTDAPGHHVCRGHIVPALLAGHGVSHRNSLS